VERGASGASTSAASASASCSPAAAAAAAAAGGCKRTTLSVRSVREAARAGSCTALRGKSCAGWWGCGACPTYPLQHRLARGTQRLTQLVQLPPLLQSPALAPAAPWRLSSMRNGTPLHTVDTPSDPYISLPVSPACQADRAVWQRVEDFYAEGALHTSSLHASYPIFSSAALSGDSTLGSEGLRLGVTCHAHEGEGANMLNCEGTTWSHSGWFEGKPFHLPGEAHQVRFLSLRASRTFKGLRLGSTTGGSHVPATRSAASCMYSLAISRPPATAFPKHSDALRASRSVSAQGSAQKADVNPHSEAKADNRIIVRVGRQ
jgi:hypothetical protein